MYRLYIAGFSIVLNYPLAVEDKVATDKGIDEIGIVNSTLEDNPVTYILTEAQFRVIRIFRFQVRVGHYYRTRFRIENFPYIIDIGRPESRGTVQGNLCVPDREPTKAQTAGKRPVIQVRNPKTETGRRSVQIQQ